MSGTILNKKIKDIDSGTKLNDSNINNLHIDYSQYFDTINKIVQNRLFEKDFINKCDLRTTKYVYIKNIKDLEASDNYFPALLKTLEFL